MNQVFIHQQLNQLVSQAVRCQSTLNTTRLELAAIRAGGSETSVDSVIAALEGTIQRAKEVQEELKRIGY